MNSDKETDVLFLGSHWKVNPLSLCVCELPDLQVLMYSGLDYLTNLIDLSTANKLIVQSTLFHVVLYFIFVYCVRGQDDLTKCSLLREIIADRNPVLIYSVILSRQCYQILYYTLFVLRLL